MPGPACPAMHPQPGMPGQACLARHAWPSPCEGTKIKSTKQSVNGTLRYNFAMTMEHKVNKYGYLTEKILLAYLAGAVPVYGGASQASEIFDPETFVEYHEEDGGASEAVWQSDGIQRCAVGEAVVTPAFGRLVTELGVEHVLHVVAPDATMGSTPDEALLRQSFTALLEAASLCGARSLAVPALGCGVQGWRAAIAARAAALSVQSVAAAVGSSGEQTLDRVDMVMGDETMWRTWRAVLEKTLGPPSSSVVGTAGGGGAETKAGADLTGARGTGGHNTAGVGGQSAGGGTGTAGSLAIWTFE